MERIDGSAFKTMLLNAAAAVEINKQSINELNVFPVPDGDTGTNMSLTLNAAASSIAPVNGTVGEIGDLAAKNMVRGARGNSGVILSLLFRGFARSLKGCDDIDGVQLAAAFSDGVASAYKAVMKPAEGTILTVSRVSSELGVNVANENPSAEHVLEQMISSAHEALDETVHQNPVLEKAGVVDAGGMGFCVILEAMLRGLRGEVISSGSASGESGKASSVFEVFDTEDIKFGYCTEFIVNVDEDKRDSVLKLRAFLDSIGDSLVFVEDEDIVKVHVHTNDPGKAISEGLKYGSLSRMKIDNMREQHTEKVIITGAEPVMAAGRFVASPEKKYGFVSVSSGDGLDEVFRDIGVDNLVKGGQTMNPSTEDILRAIDATPAEVVMVLPNNKNIIMAAEQCISMSEKQVIIVPTKTIPQGVSAMLAFDENADPKKNREQMLEAAANVHTGQITYAARDSVFDGKKIKQGDYLAIADGELIANSRSRTAALKKLARELSKFSAEFITVFYGEDVDEESAESAREIFTKEYPEAEVNVVYGGQPVYYYLVSVE